jgi:putative SOS response-associated peptidase YedK
MWHRPFRGIRHDQLSDEEKEASRPDERRRALVGDGRLQTVSGWLDGSMACQRRFESTLEGARSMGLCERHHAGLQPPRQADRQCLRGKLQRHAVRLVGGSGARTRRVGRKPINAKFETLRGLPTFRDAYRKRRCIVPVDGFFEWKAIKGQTAKQPYAIAMNDGVPFGIAGIWENWKPPASGEWIRTFAIITTDANELVADIHDRMPVILAPGDYARWLGEEPDPHDLMQHFPAELMRMWPISTRVNKPENDDHSIVEPIEVATDAA